MQEYCCNRLGDLIQRDIVSEELYSKEGRLFVHLQAFYDAPFLFVSVRLKYCPFCGGRL